MTNYVTIYNFSDPAVSSTFALEIEKQFPYNKTEAGKNLTYFAFAARKEPEVEDRLRHLLNESQLSDDDFVALYFSGKKDPDEIKRVIVVGSENVAEAQLQKVPEAEHHNKLIDLLDSDIAQQKGQQQPK